MVNNRVEREMACAGLRRHVEVTLLKCQDLSLAGTHLIHHGFLLYYCKKHSP